MYENTAQLPDAPFPTRHTGPGSALAQGKSDKRSARARERDGQEHFGGGCTKRLLRRGCTQAHQLHLMAEQRVKTARVFSLLPSEGTLPASQSSECATHCVAGTPLTPILNPRPKLLWLYPFCACADVLPGQLPLLQTALALLGHSRCRKRICEHFGSCESGKGGQERGTGFGGPQMSLPVLLREFINYKNRMITH